MQVCGGHPDATPVPLGTLADTDVNTIGCRMNWAQQAAATTGADHDTFCAAASLSGGNTCGSWCETYCDYMEETCAVSNQYWVGVEDLFASRADCLSDCAGFSTDVMPGTGQTDQHFGYGDTVQCRLHHLKAAIIEPDAANLHCGHAQTQPMELCLNDTKPNVINYCVYLEKFCPDLIDPKDDCGPMVQSLVPGTYIEAGFPSFTDTADPTLGCLNHWIMQAPFDPQACAKADFDPANWTTNGGQGVCHP